MIGNFLVTYTCDACKEERREHIESCTVPIVPAVLRNCHSGHDAEGVIRYVSLTYLLAHGFRETTAGRHLCQEHAKAFAEERGITNGD